MSLIEGIDRNPVHVVHKDLSGGIHEEALTPQAAQRLWGLLLGELQKPPGHGPGHPALGGPAGAGAVPEGP